MTLQDRVDAWLLWKGGWSLARLAREVGCDPSTLSIALHGRKLGDAKVRPILSLKFAHRIEELSADWSEGPIRMEEWLGVTTDVKVDVVGDGRAAANTPADPNVEPLVET